MKSQKVIQKQIKKACAKWFLLYDTKPHIHLREGTVTSYHRQNYNLWEMTFDTFPEFHREFSTADFEFQISKWKNKSYSNLIHLKTSSILNTINT